MDVAWARCLLKAIAQLALKEASGKLLARNGAPHTLLACIKGDFTMPGLYVLHVVMCLSLPKLFPV